MTGTAHFQSSIDSDEDAPTGYRAGAGAATIEAKLADKLADIENRARRRDREARRRAFGFTTGRVRDLVRFLAFTYGDAMPDDDAGRDDFFILAQHVAGLNGDPARNIVRYVIQWCPWMGDDELAAMVKRVLSKPYKWRARSAPPPTQ